MYLFYFFLFIYYYFLSFFFFFFFLKSGQNSTKFAIDTNFVTYCLNYFVSGMPFEGLANSNVPESIMKRNMAQCFKGMTGEFLKLNWIRGNCPNFDSTSLAIKYYLCSRYLPLT